MCAFMYVSVCVSEVVSLPSTLLPVLTQGPISVLLVTRAALVAAVCPCQVFVESATQA